MKKILDNKIFRIVLSILVIASMFFLPTIFALVFKLIGLKSEILINTLTLTIYIILLILVYLPELKEEFKTFKKEIHNSLDNGFKYWLLGLFIMTVSNVIINFIVFKGKIAANEEINRQAILNNPIWYTILSVGVFAPVMEEIIFRKSTDKIFKNSLYYYIINALLFGFAHTMADLSNLLNLLYIIPYGALGFVFAVMDKKTNTTFTSIMMHSLHNLITLFLILIIL